MDADSDDPIIPAEVLRAHEDGRLVLFCGAGISVPSNLPTFEGLAWEIAKFASPLKPEESEALDQEQFDRFLHLVESRHGTPEMRHHVINRLNGASPSALHEILVELSILPRGFRLITTNFDTLLEEAASNAGVEPRIETAPRIPPLAHDWTGLVYLHGRIDEALDKDGRDLVLTSRDFGRAYLTERWASRFLTDLFRNHTVLFIGYSASDPVMRYVLDAFALPRQHASDSEAPQFYAFDNYSFRRDKEEVRLAWTTKGVHPILYLAGHSAKNHTRLEARLRTWATAKRGGQSAKSYRARTILRAGPLNLVEDTESELKWILSDPTGAPARDALRDLDADTPNASADWVPVIDRMVLPDESRLLGQRVGSTIDPTWIPLVGDRTVAHAPPLLRRTRVFAGWLARLSADAPRESKNSTETNSYKLLSWVLGQGGVVNEEVALWMRGLLLSTEDMHPGLRASWAAVLSPSTSAAGRGAIYPRSESLVAIRNGSWSDLLLEDLIAWIEPFVRFAPARLSTPHGEPEDIHHFLTGSIDLRCGDLLVSLEKSLAEAPLPDLARVAGAATNALEKAMRLASSYVGSFPIIEKVQYPEVLDLTDQERSEPWTFLADLAFASASALESIDSNQARLIYSRWAASPSYTMQQLAISALARWDSLGEEEKLGALLK